jgi:hypothetical protein
MPAFAQINELISQQLDQPEYWSEFGLPKCIAIAPQMTTSDWVTIRQHLDSATQEWQCRAVNCAAYGNPTVVIPWLNTLLGSANGAVLTRVLESLSEFSPHQIRIHLKSADFMSIAQATDSLTGIDKAIAKNALKYLQNADNSIGLD